MPLYHTTSFRAMEAILREGALRPGGAEGFVSLSGRVVVGDISGRDVTLVVDPDAVAGMLMRVEYDEAWFDAHPEHAAYVAGDGWRSQFSPPDSLHAPPDGWDEGADGEYWPDDDAEAAAWREGELDAFLAKEDEDEFVTREPGAPLPLPPGAVLALVVHGPDGAAGLVEEALDRLGLDIEVRAAADAPAAPGPW